MGVNDIMSGPIHTVFTVTGMSTDGLNSTVQVRVRDAPTYIVLIGGLTVTAVGGGTDGACAVQLGGWSGSYVTEHSY